MGVKDLWSLLEPCGVRVNVEGLQGKRLAVDTSIWLVQCLKVRRGAAQMSWGGGQMHRRAGVGALWLAPEGGGARAAAVGALSAHLRRV